MRLDPSASIHEVSHASLSSELQTLTLQALQNDPIASFPTMGQPVMDPTLKDMLMSLRSSLQGDMLSFMHNFGYSITIIEDRLSHVETNIGRINTTVNDLINTQESHMQDNKWIKDKLLDLEDRSRRNNTRSTGYRNQSNPLTYLLMYTA